MVAQRFLVSLVGVRIPVGLPFFEVLKVRLLRKERLYLSILSG